MRTSPDRTHLRERASVSGIQWQHSIHVEFKDGTSIVISDHHLQRTTVQRFGTAATDTVCTAEKSSVATLSCGVFFFLCAHGITFTSGDEFLLRRRLGFDELRLSGNGHRPNGGEAALVSSCDEQQAESGQIEQPVVGV